MRKILVPLAFVALAGCQTLGLPSPKSPAQSVFETKATYAAALSIAVQYKALPSCAVPMHPVLCSDAGTVTKIQRADAVASPALDSAEAAVRNPDFGKDAVNSAVIAANNAVVALTTITTYLKVK